MSSEDHPVHTPQEEAVTRDVAYYIVDCGIEGCALCPAVFRHPRETEAIRTARSHRGSGDVELLDISTE